MGGDEDQPPKPPDATAARIDGREETTTEDQAARLPTDVLAEILRRVPPRWLAAARCACRAWRDAVDGRRLLRADLLPLSLAGLFVHFDEHKLPEFLARPSPSAAARAVSGNLSFLPSASPHCGYSWDVDGVEWKSYNIKDHCNGLLLLKNNCVVNPATRRSAAPAKCCAGNTLKYRARISSSNNTYSKECKTKVLCVNCDKSKGKDTQVVAADKLGDTVDKQMPSSKAGGDKAAPISQGRQQTDVDLDKVQCFKCWVKGHHTKECKTEVLCVNCDKESHISSKCTWLKQRKPVATMVEFGAEGLGCFVAEHAKEPTDSAKKNCAAIIKIKG
ncbi:hypothetical protein ACQ4PT_010044 [Festuca glaucescens]